ncbi:MAG: deoxyribodipyrimidine photo-lyase [Flavobacteriales bacterium]|jgi:deoxyribodipyrimidine photo-lyase
MKTDKEKISIFWYRRDLRLSDNHGLHKALQGSIQVLPLFIFDNEITCDLENNDSRLTFIYDTLTSINTALNQHSSSIYCIQGKPVEVWKRLLDEFDIVSVFANEDYEPYGIIRDAAVQQLLAEQQINFSLFKDQVVFAKGEVVKKDLTPYTIYTPYKNKWLEQYDDQESCNYSVDNWDRYAKIEFEFPSMADLKFVRSSIKVHPYNLEELENYEKTRNFPSLNGTSDLGPHLRFGTLSIREVIAKTKSNTMFLSELIWREFFMQILYHFPHVVSNNFKKKYDRIQWRNNPEEFKKWKEGKTGYPIVDAGIRELNSTGYMHNRVRMVVAGFLCKHLLIDWKWGEAYFATKLLDYELSSNNGNWQWSAGTGCDSAPYFRVFNPTEQVKKFDPQLDYINKWIPDLNSLTYPTAIVDHKFARERAISTYKTGLI